MSEQSVREKWKAFCDDANALVGEGFRVQPGRTLDEPCGISETGAVKKPETELKRENPKPVKKPAFGLGKKEDGETK